MSSLVSTFSPNNQAQLFKNLSYRIKFNVFLLNIPKKGGLFVQF